MKYLVIGALLLQSIISYSQTEGSSTVLSDTTERLSSLKLLNEPDNLDYLAMTELEKIDVDLIEFLGYDTGFRSKKYRRALKFCQPTEVYMCTYVWKDVYESRSAGHLKEICLRISLPDQADPIWINMFDPETPTQVVQGPDYGVSDAYHRYTYNMFLPEEYTFYRAIDSEGHLFAIHLVKYMQPLSACGWDAPEYYYRLKIEIAESPLPCGLQGLCEDQYKSIPVYNVNRLKQRMERLEPKIQNK